MCDEFATGTKENFSTASVRQQRQSVEFSDTMTIRDHLHTRQKLSLCTHLYFCFRYYGKYENFQHFLNKKLKRYNFKY